MLVWPAGCAHPVVCVLGPNAPVWWQGHYTIKKAPSFGWDVKPRSWLSVVIKNPMSLLVNSRCPGVLAKFPTTGPCQSWPPNNPHPLDLALRLSLLFTCSWCVVSAYTSLALWLSLLSTCSWFVVRASTWLVPWLSLLSTCSWCVVSAYTWLSLWLSPLHL